MSAEQIKYAQRAVERAAECKASHVESVAVIETFKGQPVWSGIVEVFNLGRHRIAKRAYGWGYKDGEETRYVAVLEIPPVTSPNTAVRAAIAAGAQR